MGSIVNIGVIGTGQIGRQHLSTYQKIANAKVVAVADVDEASARAAAGQYDAGDAYADFRQLLSRDDIDAVDVCLHNNLHAPATLAALAAGKHVYCEKPMAGSYRDALAMMDAARRAGRMLAIQLTTLFDSQTRSARQLIDAGELGDLYHARTVGLRRRGRPFVDGYGSPSFVQKKIAGGGALYDMGVYHIAVILHLLGNPAPLRISGKTYQKIEMDAKRQQSSGFDVEELGVGFVRCERDVTIDIIEAWAIHLEAFEGTCVVGTRGGIRLSPFGFFRTAGDIDFNATANLDKAAFRRDTVGGDAEFYSGPQQHWIAALQGKVPLLPTAELALNTMLISEGIYLSDRLGREVTAQEVAESSISTAAVA